CVAARSTRVNPQNLIALVSPQRVADAANLYVLDCPEDIRTQISNLKQSNLALGFLAALGISSGQRAKVRSAAHLGHQLSRAGFYDRLLSTRDTATYFRPLNSFR